MHDALASKGTTALTMGLWVATLSASAAFAWLWLRLRSVRKLVVENEAGHLRSLDGLRGILALSVMVHHGFLMHGYFLDGSWDPPKTTFNEVLGRGAVAIFFMITGYLFWSKALAADGAVDVRRLYVSRFRRIVPAFVASIVATTLVVLASKGFRLVVPPAQFGLSILHHLAFGFSIFTPIDGFRMPYVLDGVTWSLAYEMVFYACLPFLALVVKLRRPWIVPLLIVAFAFATKAFPALSFVPGIVAAEIHVRPVWRASFSRYARGILAAALAVFVTASLAVPNYNAIRKPELFILAGIFYGVLFAPRIPLLARSPLLLLGTISYSIYLMHTIILFVVLGALDATVGIAHLSTLVYWSIVVASTGVVTTLALGSYAVFERPFMRAVRFDVTPTSRAPAAIDGAAAAVVGADA